MSIEPSVYCCSQPAMLRVCHDYVIDAWRVAYQCRQCGKQGAPALLESTAAKGFADELGNVLGARRLVPKSVS